jgi:hypothetical protein
MKITRRQLRQIIKEQVDQKIPGQQEIEDHLKDLEARGYPSDGVCYFEFNSAAEAQSRVDELEALIASYGSRCDMEGEREGCDNMKEHIDALKGAIVNNKWPYCAPDPGQPFGIPGERMVREHKMKITRRQLRQMKYGLKVTSVQN